MNLTTKSCHQYSFNGHGYGQHREEEVPKRMNVIYLEKLWAGVCNLIYDCSTQQSRKAEWDWNPGVERKSVSKVTCYSVHVHVGVTSTQINQLTMSLAETAGLPLSCIIHPHQSLELIWTVTYSCCSPLGCHLYWNLERVRSQRQHPLFDMALCGIQDPGLSSFFKIHGLSFIDLTEDI